MQIQHPLDKRINIIIAVILIIMAVLAFPTEGRLACEDDRSCCENVQFAINNVCWLNKSWSDCTGGYCPEAHYFYDSGAETYPEAHTHHTFGADWHMATPDDLGDSNYLKGGIFGRPSYRDKGHIHAGPYSFSGAAAQDIQVYPWKVQATSQSAFADGNTKMESEGFVWDRGYHGWSSAQCGRADRCDASGAGNTDGIAIMWENFPTANIAEVTGADMGCTGCFIIAYNETYGSTTFENPYTSGFFCAVHPAPDFHTTVGASSNIWMYWDADNNEIINITYSCIQRDEASDIADWMGNVTNYLAKEQMVRNWHDNFFSAFNYPAGYSEANISDYYNMLHSIPYNRMQCFNESSAWYITDEGRCGTVNTPNTEQYLAQWVWDSFNTDVLTLSAINESHENASWVINITVVDDIKIRVQNMAKYPTIQEWEQQVRDKGLSASTQPLGGYTALIFNTDNMSGNNNWNLLDKTYLCGDVFKALLSFHEAKMSVDGLCEFDAGELGRDAADILTAGGDSGDCTSWLAEDSLFLSNIAGICGNDTWATALAEDFNTTRDNYDAFWNASCNDGQGCYWNHDTGGSFYDFSGATDTDWAVSPMGLCKPLVWGKVSQANATYIINEILRNNFTDSATGQPFTSISTGHPSYAASGQPSGNQWNGPLWPPDYMWCYMAIKEGIDRYNYTLGEDLIWMQEKGLETVGLDTSCASVTTPWGRESYHAADCLESRWHSHPYGWGAAQTLAFTNYSIYAAASFDPPSGEAPGPPVTSRYNYNFTHPYLYFNESDKAEIMADNNNGGITQKRYDYQVNNADYTVAQCTGSVWTRPMYGERMAFVGWLFDDETRIDKAITCLDYWANNYTTWGSDSIHATSFAARAIGNMYDWLYNNMTEAKRENISQGIYNNILVPLNDTFSQVDQLEPGNARGLRANILVACLAIVADDNRSESMCGDDDDPWVESTENYIKGYLNASFPFTPDGPFEYDVYGRRGVVAAQDAHDYMINRGYNASNWTQKYQNTFAGWVYESLGITAALTARGSDRIGATDLNPPKDLDNEIMHLAVSESGHYHGMLPELLMSYCEAGIATRGICLWYYNFTVNHTEQYTTDTGFLSNTLTYLDLVKFARINDEPLLNPKDNARRGIIYDTWASVVTNTYGFVDGTVERIVRFVSGDMDLGGHPHSHDGSLQICLDGECLIDDVGTACEDNSRGERGHAGLMLNEKSHERWTATCGAYNWIPGTRDTGCGQSIYGTPSGFDSQLFTSVCPDGVLHPDKCEYDTYNTTYGEGDLLHPFATNDGMYAHAWGFQSIAGIEEKWSRQFMIRDDVFILMDNVNGSHTTEWDMDFTYPTWGNFSYDSTTARVTRGNASLTMKIGHNSVNADWVGEVDERHIYYDVSDCSLNSSPEVNISILKLNFSSATTVDSMIGGFIFMNGTEEPNVSSVSDGNDWGMKFNFSDKVYSFWVDRNRSAINMTYAGTSYYTDSNALFLRHNKSNVLTEWGIQGATYLNYSGVEQFNSTNTTSLFMELTPLNKSGEFKVFQNTTLTVYYGDLSGELSGAEFYVDGSQLTAGEFTAENNYVTFHVDETNENFQILTSVLSLNITFVSPLNGSIINNLQGEVSFVFDAICNLGCKNITLEFYRE